MTCPLHRADGQTIYGAPAAVTTVGGSWPPDLGPRPSNEFTCELFSADPRSFHLEIRRFDLTPCAPAIRLRSFPVEEVVHIAKRRSDSEIFDDLKELVAEEIAKSPNPHLPEEEDRMKKAFMAKAAARMGSDEIRALMRIVFNHVWDELEEKLRGKRISSSGPRTRSSANHKVSRATTSRSTPAPPQKADHVARRSLRPSARA